MAMIKLIGYISTKYSEINSTIGLYQPSWYHSCLRIWTEDGHVGAGKSGDKGKSTGSVLQKLDC